MRLTAENLSDLCLEFVIAFGAAHRVNALFIFDPQNRLAGRTLAVAVVFPVLKAADIEFHPSLHRVVDFKKRAVLGAALVDVARERAEYQQRVYRNDHQQNNKMRQTIKYKNIDKIQDER